MNVEKTWEQIQSLPALIYKINKREKTAVMLLDTLNRRLFGEEVCATCSKDHIKAYRKLTSLTLEQLQVMALREYKLKKGILVEFPFRSGRHFVAETMTDAIAKDYLNQHPQMIKQFHQFPANWNK